MVADVIVVTEVQDVVVLSGSSLSFAAVVATMALADLAAVMVAVATIAVALSGFYLSFAAVVATMVLADVEIPAANFKFLSLIGGVACQRRFLIFYFEYNCGGIYSHRRPKFYYYYYYLYSDNSYTLHQFHK